MTGNLVNNARILIGTTSEGAANADNLTVADSGDSGITIRSGDSNEGSLFFSDVTTGTGEYAGYVKYDHANNNLTFGTSSVDQLQINSSGNVGINESTPDSKLDIVYSSTSDATTQKLIHLRTDGTAGYVSRGLFVKVGRDGPYDNSAVHYDIVGSAGNSGTHIFEINSAERMRIDSSGNVGIGTISNLLSNATRTTLSLNNTGSAALALGVNNTREGHIYADANSMEISAVNNYMYFTAGNAERMRIDSSGNVGIGTTSPSNFLHIKNDTVANTYAIVENTTAGNAGINLKNANGNWNIVANAELRFIDNAAGDRMRIDSSGRLLVGTTTPGATAGEQLTIAGSTNAGMTIRSSASAAGSILFEDTASDRGEIQYSHNGDYMRFKTAGSERMRIDSSGNVGIGTTSPGYKLTIEDSTTPRIRIGDGIRHLNVDGGSSTQNAAIGTDYSGAFGIYTNGASNTRLHITSGGNVGIGTTSPSDTLHLNGSTGYGLKITDASSHIGVYRTHSDGAILKTASNHALLFGTNDTERMRISSSGNVGIGTSNPSGSSPLHTSTNAANATGIYLENRADAGSGDALNITFALRRSGGYAFSGTQIKALKENTWTTSPSTINSALTFSTYYQESANERMRIQASGDVLVGKVTNDTTIDGISLGSGGMFQATRSSSFCAIFNRNTNDGQVILIRQNNTTEGSINVSGTTVSLVGGHLSRWSQLPGGAIRVPILRGTVLSNIDEMCKWGDEDNEQLNRMKVSDIEGDRNVSGVFQNWDEDDEEYTDDFYCAMTGDFVIRIGKDVTVERGDLLMSAGDGTAKPQEDDIIRSKTIAKVTSTHVSETYNDGSYCVPCVLMAC
jgi:hypothetical protein